MNKFEVLASLKWYFQAKNLALNNAIRLRAPLSVENQIDLRIYYSEYFASLISATEFLLDKAYPFNSEFRELLWTKFIFSSAKNGEENYSYLRELRNSLVHRGYDLTLSSHFKDSFPLLIAPLKTRNQSGNKEFASFGFYIIDLIYKCEEVIGSLIAEHIEIFGSKLPALTAEELQKQSKQLISDSAAMPEEVKIQALKFIDSEEFVKVQTDSTVDVLKLLRLNSLEAIIDISQVLN